MKRDRLPADAELAPEALAELYCRLHEKSIQHGGMFDDSWEIEPASAGAKRDWASTALRFAPSRNSRGPFFSHFIERLVLLAPDELQRLLCAAVLLGKADTFRRCIDGGKIRRLDAVVGSTVIAAVQNLRLNTDSLPGAATPDWNVAALLGEAYAHIDKIYRGQRQLVLDYLRIALPRELPHLRSDCDEATFERQVRQAHEWYPELKWLFG